MFRGRRFVGIMERLNCYSTALKGDDMGSDVTVVGLAMGTFLIEDLAMDIPFGIAVTIPAEKALRSKDLWRGISQRSLMQIKQVVGAPSNATVATTAGVPVRGRDDLERENQALREHIARQEKAQVETDAKLDKILAALSTGLPAVVPQAPTTRSNAVARQPQAPAIVEPEAPMFIPSTIKPADVKTQVEVEKSSSETSAISEATDRLKALRRSR